MLMEGEKIPAPIQSVVETRFTKFIGVVDYAWPSRPSWRVREILLRSLQYPGARAEALQIQLNDGDFSWYSAVIEDAVLIPQRRGGSKILNNHRRGRKE